MGMRKKQHWTGREYLPRKPVATEDELVIQEALKDRGVAGGCWTLIMHGRPPRKDASEEGFRTIAAYVALRPFSCVLMAAFYRARPGSGDLTPAISAF